MTYFMAGIFSGLFMASATSAIGPIMLLQIARRTHTLSTGLFHGVRPIYIALGVVVLAYPIWIVIGAAAGLVYGTSLARVPGDGFGSPNLAFTATVLVGTILVTTPIAIIFRSITVSAITLGVLCSITFGWGLPIMAK